MSYAPEAGGARKRVIRADANKALIFLMRRQTSRRLSMIILLGTVMASEGADPDPHASTTLRCNRLGHAWWSLKFGDGHKQFGASYRWP